MSLWLASSNQRFKETAKHFKKVETNDGEQLRASIEGTSFRCCEYELQRVNRMIVAEGVISKQATFAILTDYSDAIKFEPEDKILYRGHKYKIIYRGKIKNFATPSSVAYVLGLV